MADCSVTGQAVDHMFAGKMVADQTAGLVAVEMLAIEGHDAAGFLAAMLEGMQAQRGVGGRLAMAKNREYAALFVEFVEIVQVTKTVWWAVSGPGLGG